MRLHCLEPLSPLVQTLLGKLGSSWPVCLCALAARRALAGHVELGHLYRSTRSKGLVALVIRTLWRNLFSFQMRLASLISGAPWAYLSTTRLLCCTLLATDLSRSGLVSPACRTKVVSPSLFTPTPASVTTLLGRPLLTRGFCFGSVVSSSTTVLVTVSPDELPRPSNSGNRASALSCCASWRLRLPLSIRSCCLLAPFFFLGAVVLMRGHPLSGLVRCNPLPISWCGSARDQLERWLQNQGLCYHAR